MFQLCFMLPDPTGSLRLLSSPTFALEMRNCQSNEGRTSKVPNLVIISNVHESKIAVKVLKGAEFPLDPYV